MVANRNKATRIRNQDTIHFENATYKVLHLRSSITAPFAEHQKFQEKNDFYTFTLGQTWQNKINKTRIRALYISNLLYAGCSTKEAITLLLLWNTENFKKKRLLQRYFG